MKIRDRLKNAIRAFNYQSASEINMGDENIIEWLGIVPEGKSKKEINEITYFTCLKMLSETMGKLPIKYYKQTDRGKIRADPDRNYYLLSVRPNRIMTPTTFWTTVEYNTEHYGNGYVWIHDTFEGGNYKIIDLWVMPSKDVQVLVDDKGIFGTKGDVYYQYTDQYTHEVYLFPSRRVMHFKTWLSYDGILGQPVREILRSQVDGALESQNFMNNLYKQGLTAAMALQYVGDLDEKKIGALQKKYSKFLTGSKNAGKIVPVPMGLTLTPLKMNLTDAQFFELKKYTALQIAGAFGIKPNQINNYEKSSYANSETQQLAFLVDTMLYRLKAYEEEINYKILGRQAMIRYGLYFKFNEKAILRTDSKTQMENLAKAVNNGIYMPNEARDYLDLPMDPYGNQLIVNGNYIPLSQVGKQYKGGDTNEEGNPG